MTLTVSTLLWDANSESHGFSRCYDETWVHKLYDGFNRNLTVRWRFVLFTDRHRPEISGDIKQELLRWDPPGYGSCIEPYRYGVPMLLVGLDTIIVGNCDPLANYCLSGTQLALPLDPNRLPGDDRCCNGVALIPAGHQCIYRNWQGENDMEYVRKQPHITIDELFPGYVVSYKCQVKKRWLGKARIVYFHGNEKPHELSHPWIEEHWRIDNG